MDAYLARCNKYNSLVIVRILKKSLHLFANTFYLINPFIIINSKASNTNVAQGHFIIASFNITQKYSLLK